MKAQAGISQRSDDGNEYLGACWADTSLFNSTRAFRRWRGVPERQWDPRHLYAPLGSGRSSRSLPIRPPPPMGCRHCLKSGDVHTSLGSGGTITRGRANFLLSKAIRSIPMAAYGLFQFGSLVSGVQMIGGEGQSTITGFDMIPATRASPLFKDPRTTFPTRSRLRSSCHTPTTWCPFTGPCRVSPGARLLRDERVFPAVPFPRTWRPRESNPSLSRKNAFDLGQQPTSWVTNQIPRAVFALNGRIGETWTWDTGIPSGVWIAIIRLSRTRRTAPISASRSMRSRDRADNLSVGLPRSLEPRSMGRQLRPAACLSIYSEMARRPPLPSPMCSRPRGPDSHYDQTKDATANIKRHTDIHVGGSGSRLPSAAEYRNGESECHGEPHCPPPGALF